MKFNDVHCAGYYGFDRSFVAQIQIGGALDYKISNALLKSAKELLSNIF
jgi:hypothetical protein